MAARIHICTKCHKDYFSNESVCPKCGSALVETSYTETFWQTCPRDKRERLIEETLEARQYWEIPTSQKKERKVDIYSCEYRGQTLGTKWLRFIYSIMPLRVVQGILSGIMSITYFLALVQSISDRNATGKGLAFVTALLGAGIVASIIIAYKNKYNEHGYDALMALFVCEAFSTFVGAYITARSYTAYAFLSAMIASLPVIILEIINMYYLSRRQALFFDIDHSSTIPEKRTQPKTNYVPVSVTQEKKSEEKPEAQVTEHDNSTAETLEPEKKPEAAIEVNTKPEEKPKVTDEKITTEANVSETDIPAFCGKCGKKIVPGNQFCVYCGAPITSLAEQPKKEAGYKVSAAPQNVDQVLTGKNEKSSGAPVEQKKTRNRKKIIISSVISVVAVIAILIGVYEYSYHRSLNFAKEGKYDQAESWLLVPGITKLHNPDLLTYIEAGHLMDSGDYDQAMELIKGMDENSNVHEMAQEARYQKAAKLLADGDTETAFDIYAELRAENYKDARQIYMSILKDEFQTAIADGDYETALNLYDNYPASYFDYDQNQADYLEAMRLYIDGTYADAEKKFEKLGDYADSATMAEDCIYQEGVWALSNGMLDRAQKLFDSIPDYSDATDQSKECTYQVAKNYYENGNVLAAYGTMSTVTGYSDADALIEQYTTELYDEAKEYYQSAKDAYLSGESSYLDFGNAEERFSAISDYKYSTNYLVLIEGFQSRGSDETYKKLVNLISLDDAKYCILDTYSFKFLCGNWSDSSGLFYYFNLTNTSGSSYQANYNLPSNYGGSFELDDGLYTVNGNKVFKFSIVSYNSVDCYCYSDGSTKRLYRQ